MNFRYVFSVLFIAILAVAGIYAYVQYLASLGSLKVAEQEAAMATSTLSLRAQEESRELDTLREAAKEMTQVIATTTIKKEAESLDAMRKEAQRQAATHKTLAAPAKTAEQEQRELDALRAQAQAQLINQ